VRGPKELPLLNFQRFRPVGKARPAWADIDSVDFDLWRCDDMQMV